MSYYLVSRQSKRQHVTPVVVEAPGGGGPAQITDEPFYDAGTDLLVLLEDYSTGYSTPLVLGDNGAAIRSKGPANDDERGTVEVVPGEGGVGFAARFWYHPDGTPGIAADRTFNAMIAYNIQLMNGGATFTDLCIEYRYRTMVNFDPTHGDGTGNGSNNSGFKWNMLWRAVGARYTNGVGRMGQTGVNGWPTISAGSLTCLKFTVHDNSSPETNVAGAMPNPLQQNVTAGPNFGNDGNWHTYKLRISTGNSNGDTSGFEMIWHDGTLILDTRSTYTGRTITRDSGGIYMLQCPGEMVSNPSSSSWIEFDMIRCWVENG